MSEVSLKGIIKYYGNHLALPSLDLEIPKGKFVTLLGPSGCGKTTTLRIIAGLETPTEGELSLAQKLMFSSASSVNIPPEKRGLGFIFQSYALWPNMKVERNITLALHQAKMKKTDIAERLDEALTKVQLQGLSDRFPSELSGGQQQRVAVGRLIAARNDILLMDEPLSNLDAVLRTEMRAELKRLSRDLGATTIYVTHDQVEALTMSDLIVVMKDGTIQQIGSPYDIYHRPTNLFVAEFIGDPKVNLFKATLTRNGENARVTGSGFDFSIPVNAATSGTDVTVAVRPEHLRLHTKASDGAIQARIDVLQPSGSQTLISMHAGDLTLTSLVSQFLESWPQDELWVDFDPAHAMLFDTRTSQAIATQDSMAAESAA